MFMQDLFKPSIQLEEHILKHTPRTSPDANGLIPALGVPPGENDPVLMSKANLGPSAELTKPSPRLEGEVLVKIRVLQTYPP
jgi:hypothetical protein